MDVCAIDYAHIIAQFVRARKGKSAELRQRNYASPRYNTREVYAPFNMTRVLRSTRHLRWHIELFARGSIACAIFTFCAIFHYHFITNCAILMPR
jgi:hypothetical protein